MPDTATQSRVLAKLIRDVLRDEEFETLADLVDVLKTRAARLRIRWTPDDVSDALRMVGSNRTLVRREQR